MQTTIDVPEQVYQNLKLKAIDSNVRVALNFSAAIPGSAWKTWAFQELRRRAAAELRGMSESRQRELARTGWSVDVYKKWVQGEKEPPTPEELLATLTEGQKARLLELLANDVTK